MDSFFCRIKNTPLYEENKNTKHHKGGFKMLFRMTKEEIQKEMLRLQNEIKDLTSRMDDTMSFSYKRKIADLINCKSNEMFRLDHKKRRMQLKEFKVQILSKLFNFKKRSST